MSDTVKQYFEEIASWQGIADRAESRALAYEQALREARQYVADAGNDEDPETQRHSQALLAVIDAALDKPGDIPQTPDVQCIPRPE